MQINLKNKRFTVKINKYVLLVISGISNKYQCFITQNYGITKMIQDICFI